MANTAEKQSSSRTRNISFLLSTLVFPIHAIFALSVFEPGAFEDYLFPIYLIGILVGILVYGLIGSTLNFWLRKTNRVRLSEYIVSGTLVGTVIFSVLFFLYLAAEEEIGFFAIVGFGAFIGFSSAGCYWSIRRPDIPLDKRKIIPVMKILLVSLGSAMALLLFIKGFLYIPSFNKAELSHPAGYSILVDKKTYACATETGFIVASAVPVRNAINCNGPLPKKVKPDILNFNRFPYNDDAFSIVIDTKISEASEMCGENYYKNFRLRGFKKVSYWVCSGGGGSGGEEYFSKGTLVYDGKVFTGSEFMQTEWGVPKFLYVWETMLTIRRTKN